MRLARPVIWAQLVAVALLASIGWLQAPFRVGDLIWLVFPWNSVDWTLIWFALVVVVAAVGGYIIAATREGRAQIGWVRCVILVAIAAPISAWGAIVTNPEKEGLGAALMPPLAIFLEAASIVPAATAMWLVVRGLGRRAPQFVASSPIE